MKIFKCIKNVLSPSYFLQPESGLTLVEVLIALSAVVIIISAITTAVLSALNNVTFTKNQNQATQYAQQGIEIMRHLRDYDYATFSSLSLDYCLAKTCTTLDSTKPACWTNSSSCGLNVDNFIRDVYVTQKGANTHCANQETEVKVTVSWSDGKCPSTNQYCQHVSVVSCFSNNSTAPVP